MKIITKFIILSSIIFLISCQSENQQSELEENFALSKQEMLQDFDVFESIFKKANAGLYKYRSESEIDSVFQKNRAEINEHFSYREFYNILWNVMDFTGSCHNALTFPETLDQHLNEQNIFFPIPLKFLENKIYTNLEYENIPLGSEIISVNNWDADQWMKSISKYVSTDGFNKTGKHTQLETDWMPFYVYLAMGKQKQFDIEYKTKDSDILNTSSISSVSYHDFYKNYLQRYSKEFEDRKSNEYSFEMLDSINTGFLEIPTFALGGTQTNEHKKYAAFLDSVFTTLQTQKVENLIIDLRGNGGGDDPNDLLLYSYLTEREFKENISAYTLFQEIPFQEYYVYDDAETLTNSLKTEHSILKDDKFYQNGSHNKSWKPKTNAFQGRIILLIDSYIASAGSLFASLVKSDENSIIIGEETLGGYYGHTGHIPLTYELPHSKLRLTFSIVDLEQDVKKLSDQKLGDGVKPDFEVGQSYADFINHQDTQLNFAIEKIKNL